MKCRHCPADATCKVVRRSLADGWEVRLALCDACAAHVHGRRELRFEGCGCGKEATRPHA